MRSGATPRPDPPAQGERPIVAGHEPTGDALYLFGVARSRSWRVGGQDGDELVRVRYRDLEALVRAVPYALPDLREGDVKEHQRVVESAFRRGTILPAPYGLVFRGRRSVIRFLEDQYIVLDEGLAFLDGHWELRLHIAPRDGDPDEHLRELALHLYSELRRFARAALPLRKGDDRLFSAAFLVERATWIEFVERADDMSTAHPDVTFDITGPWPPYDFVRMV